MEQQMETTPPGSQSGEKPIETSRIWSFLNPLGDLTLAGVALFLLFHPTPSSVMTLSVVAGLRYLLGPKVGLVPLAALTLFLSLVFLIVQLEPYGHSQGKLTACKSNLKNIATALEMYSTDNDGLYPHSLAHLTPMYLKSIPSCPAASLDTYSVSYQHQAQPDVFTIDCHGINHKASGITSANYPRYGNLEGIIDR
jgi:hypothetical protein